MTPLISLNCILGENPLWNVDDQCLYWEDIDGRKVHKIDPATGTHTCIYDESAIEGGQKVGGFTFQTDGKLLLFRERDLATINTDGSGLAVIKPFADEGFVRFNDVMADPEGRVYAGSIGADEKSGGLYLVEPDGNISVLWKGCQISNGMGFSPDFQTFYWTDSTRSTILKFPYDKAAGMKPVLPYAEDGSVKPEHLFYAAPESEGTTDGMTVDTNGDIWTARWDGNAIIHLTPGAKVVGKLDIPGRNVTSLCFGGANLDQFFVTTAQPEGPENQHHATPDDGAIYQVAAGVTGPEEFRSKIMI